MSVVLKAVVEASSTMLGEMVAVDGGRARRDTGLRSGKRAMLDSSTVDFPCWKVDFPCCAGAPGSGGAFLS